MKHWPESQRKIPYYFLRKILLAFPTSFLVGHSHEKINMQIYQIIHLPHLQQ